LTVDPLSSDIEAILLGGNAGLNIVKLILVFQKAPEKLAFEKIYSRYCIDENDQKTDDHSVGNGW
jgi:hypothetical protein